MRRSLLLSAMTIAVAALATAQVPAPREALLRCDDIGMCHAVNVAAQRVLESGIPFSASVMFACPWYQEAVEILRGKPQVSVGIHLTLNAEWRTYRWGPVAGAGTVPSLVDSLGLFFPSRATFFANRPTLKDVETELRAQIRRALASGLQIDYMDYHMGTAVDTPEMRALVERLAAEYGLGISRYFGEVDAYGLYSTPAANKTDTLLAMVERIQPGVPQLLVFHVGLDVPEMQAMIDLNPNGPPDMSRHREGELRAITSEAFRSALDRSGVKLLTYRDLMSRLGRQGMKRP